MCVVDEMKTEAQRKQAAFRPIRSGPAEALPILIGRWGAAGRNRGRRREEEEDGGARAEQRSGGSAALRRPWCLSSKLLCAPSLWLSWGGGGGAAIHCNPPQLHLRTCRHGGFRGSAPSPTADASPSTFRCLLISQKRIAPAFSGVDATDASGAPQYFDIGLNTWQSLLYCTLQISLPCCFNQGRFFFSNYNQTFSFFISNFVSLYYLFYIFLLLKEDRNILPMAKTSLPPGFRFHPTDVELTVYYLKRKLLGKHLRCNAITEIDLYKFAPWDLPEKASLESNDLVWYFFCPRDRKYSSGLRTNRSTGVGYWKATGKDRPVFYNSRTVGMKRTLVFHLGKPPRGDRTDWVMYEYRLEDEELVASGVKLDACVLCKIFQKSGPGPKIGAQYGAPFNEEDWNDASNAECSPFASSKAPCAPESSHGGLNSAGQHLAVSYDDKVSLPLLSESNNEHAVNHVHPYRPSSNIPIDSIHIQLLAEIIRCSSTNLRCTAAEDGSLPDSTAGHDDDGESGDDIETIFCGVDELASQPLVNNSNHCDSCEHLIHRMPEARGTEQYLELNDLSFSLAEGPDSRGMLLSNEISVEQPLDLEPRFERDSLGCISNTVNTSTSTADGSFPSACAVDVHGT